MPGSVCQMCVKLDLNLSRDAHVSDPVSVIRMQCEFHNNPRSMMFEKIISNFPTFSTLNQNEKNLYIWKYEWKFLGKYLKSAWENRKKKLYI